MIMRWMVVAVSLLATGCLTTKEFTPTLRYTLAPTIPVTAPGRTSEETLAVRPLESARPYKQNIVYRNGLEIGHYTSVEWAELPADAVGRALRDALLASGRYRDVGSALDLTKPTYILTGQLRKFDLVKDSQPWHAEIEVRLEVREALGRNLVWASTLPVTEPLDKDDIGALPAAMGRAVSRLIADATAGITAQ